MIYLERRHDAKPVIGGISGCYNDNLVCHKWEKISHHTDSKFLALQHTSSQIYDKV